MHCFASKMGYITIFFHQHHKVPKLAACVRVHLQTPSKKEFHVTLYKNIYQFSLTAAQRVSHFVWFSKTALHSHTMQYKPTFTMPYECPCPMLTENAHFKGGEHRIRLYSLHLLRMFQTLLGNGYATCLPSIFRFHTHTYTRTHKNTPKRPTWDKMRLIEEPISHLLPHPPCSHTHMHTCARSHTELVVQRWLYPKLTKSDKNIKNRLKIMERC